MGGASQSSFDKIEPTPLQHQLLFPQNDKQKSDSDDTEFHDFTKLGEFQLALRTMRTAASFIKPWNFSFSALENFLINTKFCKDDLGDCENRAQMLTQFVDYVISENASKWRRGAIPHHRRTQKYVERVLLSQTTVGLHQEGSEQTAFPA
jgi:hypothetical protein